MITAHMRRVYRAPTAGRDFLTPYSAANKEAAALIKKKYPSERSVTDEFGRIEDPGWHFTADERLVRLRARVARLLLKKLKSTKGESANG